MPNDGCWGHLLMFSRSFRHQNFLIVGAHECALGDGHWAGILLRQTGGQFFDVIDVISDVT